MGQSRVSAPPRTLLGAAVAGAAASLIYAIAWWWQHQGIVLPPASIPAFMIGFSLAAFGAGVVSGRLRDIPITWLAMTIAITVVYWIHFTLFPDWPQSEDGIYGPILFGALYLLPFSVAGHALAVFARRRRRGSYGAPPLR